MSKINQTALYFSAFDNITCTVSGFDIGVDSKGNYYFSGFKSYVNPESDRSPYIAMKFTNFGTTEVPYGCDEVVTPTATNTFADYYEMSGEPRKVEIYIDELEMKIDENIKYFVEEEDFMKLSGKSYADAETAGEYDTDANELDSSKLYVYKDGKYFKTTSNFVKDPAYAKYDLVLRVGETIDVSLFVGPDNWNKEGLTEWHFTGEEKVEQYINKI